LKHRGYTPQARLAATLDESLLADAPLLGRAAVEAYAKAKAHAPDDDEGKMIEIVSRPK
jgi:3-hydroxyisobutyrate dehydrogenase